MEFPTRMPESNLLASVGSSGLPISPLKVFSPKSSSKKPDTIESRQDIIDFIDDIFHGIGNPILLKAPIHSKSFKTSPQTLMNAERIKDWYDRIDHLNQHKIHETGNSTKSTSQTTSSVNIRKFRVQQYHIANSERLDEPRSRQNRHINMSSSITLEDTSYHTRGDDIMASCSPSSLKAKLQKNETKKTTEESDRDLATILKRAQARKAIGTERNIPPGCEKVKVENYLADFDELDGMEEWDDSDDEMNYKRVKEKRYMKAKAKRQDEETKTDEDKNRGYIRVAYPDCPGSSKNTTPASYGLVTKSSTKNKIIVKAPHILQTTLHQNSGFVDVPLGKGKILYEDYLTIIEKSMNWD